jgi:hypothetical protein
MKLRDHDEEILNKQIAENKAVSQLAVKEQKIAIMKK